MFIVSLAMIFAPDRDMTVVVAEVREREGEREGQSPYLVEPHLNEK